MRLTPHTSLVLLALGHPSTLAQEPPAEPAPAQQEAAATGQDDAAAAGQEEGAAAEQEEGLFLDLLYEEATQLATEQEKFIFVAWEMEGSGACLRMERQTYADPALRAWLEENTIPVLYDIVVDSKLAKTFGRQYAPSAYLIGPGGIVDHRAGFHTPEQLLSFLDAASYGVRTSEAPAMPTGEAAEDPYAHLAWANHVRLGARPGDAIETYLWCLDHGDEFDPGFRAKYFDYLVFRVRSAGARYSLSRTGIEVRRDRLETRLLSLEATPAEANEYNRFNVSLRAEQQSALIFLQLLAAGEEGKVIRDELFSSALPHLVAQKRFKQIRAHCPDLAAHIGERAAPLAKLCAEHPELLTPGMLRPLFEEAGLLYYVALFEGNGATARQILDAALAVKPNHRGYEIFIRQAFRAGLGSVAEQIVERAATEHEGERLGRIKRVFSNPRQPGIKHPDDD